MAAQLRPCRNPNNVTMFSPIMLCRPAPAGPFERGTLKDKQAYVLWQFLVVLLSIPDVPGISWSLCPGVFYGDHCQYAKTTLPVCFQKSCRWWPSHSPTLARTGLHVHRFVMWGILRGISAQPVPVRCGRSIDLVLC